MLSTVGLASYSTHAIVINKYLLVIYEKFQTPSTTNHKFLFRTDFTDSKLMGD